MLETLLGVLLFLVVITVLVLVFGFRKPGPGGRESRK